MYRFFVEEAQIQDGRVRITGGDVNHIRNVLRLRPGERIYVSAGGTEEYCCVVEEYQKDQVTAVIEKTGAADTELPAKVWLFQGLPKGDKMDLIVQKAVELGTAAIVPVAMERCVVKLDSRKAAARAERWQNIALSAAKQSKRMQIPTVSPVVSYREALSMAASLDVRLIPYELARGMVRTREILSAVRPGQSVAVFIGPEGGIAEGELAQAIEIGAEPVSLGRRILRTETAGLMVLSVLGYLLEDADPLEDTKGKG